MPLSIVTHPNPILNTPSKNIAADVVVQKDMQTFITDLTEAMYKFDGVGLAAPQVGKNIRMFVVDSDALKHTKILKGTVNKDKPFVAINPQWTLLSKKTNWDLEGCLSVPNVYGKVKRFSAIILDCLDKDGNVISLQAKGMSARVIQHETDHVDGVLFIEKAKNLREITH